MSDFPQSGGRARIAGNDDRALTVADDITEGRDYVADPNRSYSKAIRLHGDFRLERAEAQIRRHVLREGDEIGPHHVVENVRLHGIKGLGASLPDRFTASSRRSGQPPAHSNRSGVTPPDRRHYRRDRTHRTISSPSSKGLPGTFWCHRKPVSVRDHCE